MSAATNGTARDGEVGARVPASPAASARAYRARKQQQREAVTTIPATIAPVTPSTVTPVPPVTMTVTTAITFTAGLALASVSGGFSITGLTHIFAGAPVAVIGMGAVMELGKVAATMWIARGYTAPLMLRLAVITLVVALMVITSIGVFGFLAAAHIAHTVTAEQAIGASAAEVAGRIRVQTDTLADIDKRVAQVDAAVTEATRRGRVTGAMALAADQTKRRGTLATERVTAATKLAALQVEASAIEGQRKTLAADTGPVPLPRPVAARRRRNPAALVRTGGRVSARPVGDRLVARRQLVEARVMSPCNAPHQPSPYYNTAPPSQTRFDGFPDPRKSQETPHEH